MKALRLTSVNKIELVDVPLPEIKDDELLIKTGAAVICTSDINDLKQNPFGIQLPVIMGHEAAGTVAKTGCDVHDFKVGDKIVAHPCGTCQNCGRGHAHLCARMGHFGANMQGTFAEYFTVRVDRARCVPKGVSFRIAALTEPVCVCLEALHQANLKTGDKLLIIGDGPFGALISRLASAFAHDKTVWAGRHDFRLGFAGIDVECVNTRNHEDHLGELLIASDGEGYDAVILCVGSHLAVMEGMKLLAARGRAVIFFAVTELVPIDLFTVHMKEQEIIGACNDNNRMDQAIALLSDPKVEVGDLITHEFTLDEFEEAFRLVEKGRNNAMKVAFTFGDGKCG